MLFSGNIIVYCDGSSPRQFVLPTVTIAETSIDLWDPEKLLAFIRSALPSSFTVQEVALPWSTPSEQSFLSSVNDMILRAHSHDSVVYVAIRTSDNTNRFGLLHALSGENMQVLTAIINKGSILCSPTEAIVYHADNMVKLPTSMSLLQATRRVADMVLNGADTPCPICLEPICLHATVFIPCECKAPIHISCLRLLYERGSDTCPLCRTNLEGHPDMR